jgi:hypothetical protein
MEQYPVSVHPDSAVKQINYEGPHPSQPGLEVVSHPQPAWGYQQQQQGGAHPARICGVARTTFLLAVALVIVIVAAAVGGGVGGSLAVQNAKK